MTKNAILLSYELSEENILTVAAKTNIKPDQTAAEYQLILTLTNNINNQTLTSDTFTGQLPLEGQKTFEPFPYFAQHGCDFKLSAELICKDTTTDTRTDPVDSSLGAHIAIRFIGWENCFHPAWSYCCRSYVSSDKPTAYSFDSIELSLKPDQKCLVLSTSMRRLCYQNSNHKWNEYNGALIVDQDHTCFKTCEPLTDISCEKGLCSFYCLFKVTYKSQDDPSHQETAYITLSNNNNKKEKVCL